MTVEVTDETWADVAAAIRFYDSRPGRYGADVFAEFERAIGAIGAAPRQFSPVEDEYPGTEVREYLIGRFDQRVIYMIESERI